MNEQFEIEVGEKLKVIQKRLGYSDQVLAKKAGISVNTLKAVFGSSHGTLHGNYVKVAGALGKKIYCVIE